MSVAKFVTLSLTILTFCLLVSLCCRCMTKHVKHGRKTAQPSASTDTLISLEYPPIPSSVLICKMFYSRRKDKINPMLVDTTHLPVVESSSSDYPPLQTETSLLEVRWQIHCCQRRLQVRASHPKNLIYYPMLKKPHRNCRKLLLAMHE